MNICVSMRDPRSGLGFMHRMRLTHRIAIIGYANGAPIPFTATASTATSAPVEIMKLLGKHARQVSSGLDSRLHPEVSPHECGSLGTQLQYLL